MSVTSLSLALWCIAAQAVPSAEAQAPPEIAPLDREAAATVRDKAVEFLVRTQHEDGSWARSSTEGLLDSRYAVESFYAWQVGAHQLAVLALLDVPATPERDATLHRAVRWLLDARMPLRGSDWDNDAAWAYLYGTILCTHAAEHPRLSEAERAALAARGREFLVRLLDNESPSGGFAYYDLRPYSQRPTWATSFCTAAVLPSLIRAEELGWLTDRTPIERALTYVQRCALPGGAYEYDLRPVPRITGGEHINRVKGSLGRTQVCNWARIQAGDEGLGLDAVRTGLANFFAEHRFLDVARMRPVPHEAYYANAGYFYFFGHYYAALAIELLPEGEREARHGLLRAHIGKTQREDGSFCDFLGQTYMVIADTAFAVLAVHAGL